ncbi:unnamed protein product [Closterium sp. NIES-54]
MVTTTTPRGQRVSICTCTRTGRHLSTFTRWPGSSLYTLATEPLHVATSAQVSASGLCLPCVEGRQRAAPHSSSFPPMTAPLQTLHMDVWGPARVTGQGRERYFLLVVDDYTRYTTVFLLRSKGEAVDVLIPWICTVRLQLREQFGQDLPILCLHSDRGGELSSDLLRDFCHGEGILQSFTLPISPLQNGIAERRIGLVMEVARTSMIHAAAPHFMWLFAVRYAAHQLNLWPHVSLLETSPTLCWTGEVGDASVFRFYHPTLRRIFPSQDVTFDEMLPFYSLFPYCSAPPPPSPLFLAPGPPPVDPLPPQGLAPSGVSQVGPLPGTAPVEVAVGSGAARGAASGGAASGGAQPGGAESEGAGSGGAELGGAEHAGVDFGGAEPEGVEPGGAESERAESGGAEPRGAASSGGSAGASPRLSPQQLLLEVIVPGVLELLGLVVLGTLELETLRSLELLELEVVALLALELEELELEALAWEALEVQELELLTVELEVLGVPSSTSLTPPLLCPPPDQTQPPLLSASPLPAPSPFTEQSGGLTERREPAFRPVLPVHTTHRVPRSRPPPVPSMHAMELRPSSVPLRVSLPAPPESSLPEVSDPESDLLRN